MSKFVQRFFKPLSDPRYFQIIFLGGFLGFGCLSLGWKTEWLNYSIIILTCLATQYFFIKIKSLPTHSLRSAFITALGLCLLLRSESLWILCLAAALAISSKFLIRFRGKHVFNPANFGIIVGILLTGSCWINPGQWGSETAMLVFFGGAGLMILLKISRLETAITFFSLYSILLFIQVVVYQGWEVEVFIHKLTNGSLLLFTFFMITDPMTIPNKRKGRIAWAAILAIIIFVSSSWFYVQTASLWVLFFITPLTLYFDKIMPTIKYNWPTIHTSKNIPSPIK